MSNRAIIPTRTLGAEIERVLSSKVGSTKVSGTVRWIASQISAPVRAVSEELAALALQGKVKSRTHRGGEVLYRLKDSVDDRWDALRAPAIHLN